MIHHVAVFASDLAASRRFYEAALGPLGVVLGYQADDTAEFWKAGRDTPSLSVERATDGPTVAAHLAFAASDPAQVDAFFDAAIAAGGTPRHAPRHWPEYRAYCAFVSDPDGNNIEAVCKDAWTA